MAKMLVDQGSKIYPVSPKSVRLVGMSYNTHRLSNEDYSDSTFLLRYRHFIYVVPGMNVTILVRQPNSEYVMN